MTTVLLIKYLDHLKKVILDFHSYGLSSWKANPEIKFLHVACSSSLLSCVIPLL